MKDLPDGHRAPSGGPHLITLPGRLFPALQERDFRTLWAGMLPGILAMQMYFFVNGYYAYELTGAASSIGIISLGFGLPMLVLSLVGGMTADRHSKRRILLITQAMLVAGAALTALLVMTGTIRVAHMALIGVLMGTAFTFHMPARQSFIAELTSPPRLMNAIALSGASLNASRVLGPPLAGILIGVSWIGVGGVFVIMALMFALVAVSLLRITEAGRVGAEENHTTGFRAMMDGLSYIRSTPVLVVLLLLSFAPIILGMPYQALMPVFAKEVFSVGPGGLGILMMANGFGALAGSLLVASFRQLKHPGMIQLTLGILFGLSLALFSLVTSYVPGIIILCIVGMISAAYLSLNAALLMQKADKRYHGRVMSIYMLTFSLLPLGNFIISILADAFGAPATVGTCGVLLALLVFLFGRLSSSYRRM